MAYCVKCGAKVEDAVKFCPQCGGEIPVMATENTSYESQDGANQNSGQTYEQQGYQETGNQDQREYFNATDVQQNKVFGVISYLGLLVLVSICARDKQSEYTLFHANQGLVLFLTSVVANALTGNGWFSWMSWWYFDYGILQILSGIVGIAIFVLSIMGIVNACHGERKELPLIGKIKLLK